MFANTFEKGFEQFYKNRDILLNLGSSLGKINLNQFLQ